MCFTGILAENQLQGTHQQQQHILIHIPIFALKLDVEVERKRNFSLFLSEIWCVLLVLLSVVLSDVYLQTMWLV